MSTDQPQRAAFHDVLAGIQNFCIIEQRKAPDFFAELAPLCEEYDGPEITLRRRYGDEGPEIIVARPGYYPAYLALLAARDQYSRRAFQVAMGRLLGYSEESINEWITEGWPACACACSKCGGPLTKTERLEIDARLARTQYWNNYRSETA